MSHLAKPNFLLRLVCALLLLAAAAAVHADEVHLTNGRVLRGEVVQADDEFVVVRVPSGTIKLRRSQVDYIERETPSQYRLGMVKEYLLRQRYDLAVAMLEEARSAAPASAQERAELARAWEACGRRFLSVRRLAEARGCFARLQELQPDSAAAGEGLAAAARDEQQLGQVLSAARAALAAEDFDGAIRKFAEAQEFSPDALGRAASAWARAQALRAERSYRARRYDQAAADLERAFSLDPGLAPLLEDLYVAAALSAALARTGQQPLARTQEELAHILSLAPANAHVLYVAGRLEEDLQNLPRAGAFFARALQTRVSNASAERVAELRRQLERRLEIPPDGGIRFRVQAVDEGLYAQAKAGEFEVLESGCFAIFHHNDALAAEVARALDAGLPRILDATGLRVDWPEKVKVFIYRTQEEYAAATGQNPWTGGSSRFVRFAGKGIAQLEIHSWQTSRRLLNSVLPHELTHLVVNSNLSSLDDLPRAIHEGLAIQMEPPYRLAHYLQFLRTRLRSHSFIPLADLLTMKDYPHDPEFFYAEGACLVAYLTQAHGLRKVFELSRRTGAVEGFVPRLLALTAARSLDALEADWLKWVGK